MTSNNIWMDSGAMVSMIPEMDLYLGDFASSSSNNNQNVITLGTAFTGKFSLVANLYRGCYLNIYVGTAHGSFTLNQHIDRVMIQSNASGTITVNDSLPAAFTSDETKFYGIIEHFGAPVPAPSLSGTATLQTATITTAGTNVLASQAIIENSAISTALSGSSTGAELQLTLSPHSSDITMLVAASDGSNYQTGFLTIQLASATGDTTLGVVFDTSAGTTKAGSAFDDFVEVNVPDSATAVQVATAIQTALANENVSVSRAGAKLTITNTTGGYVGSGTMIAMADSSGAATDFGTLSNDVDGGIVTAVSISNAGSSVSGSGNLTITSAAGDNPVLALAAGSSGNPRLLSDSWLGLTESVSIPSTSVETKAIPISSGSRSMTYQFKGMETTSGGSFSVTANNFSWLYYALGNKEITSIGATAAAVTVSDEFTTSGLSETNFVYDTDAPTVGFNRVEGNTICPPLNPILTQNTANVKKVNTGTLTEKITYALTESNSENLPTFALEYTLKKPDSQSTVAVDAGSQILPNGDYTTDSDGTFTYATDTSKETVYSKIYPGCMVSSLTLDASATQEVNMNVNFETKKTFVAPTNYDTANGLTDVRDFVNFGSPQGGIANEDEILLRPFFFSDGTISMFGQDYIRIETMSLEISNSITPKRFIGRYDKTSQMHFPGQRTYNLSFTGLVTDSAVFDALRENQAFSLSGTDGNQITLRFTKEAGSTDESLEMVFQDYMVTTADFPLTNDKGPISVSWTIVPLKLKSCSHVTNWIIQG